MAKASSNTAITIKAIRRQRNSNRQKLKPSRSGQVSLGEAMEKALALLPSAMVPDRVPLGQIDRYKAKALAFFTPRIVPKMFLALEHLIKEGDLAAIRLGTEIFQYIQQKGATVNILNQNGVARDDFHFEKIIREGAERRALQASTAVIEHAPLAPSETPEG